MRAVVVRGFGAADQLSLSNLPDPTPDADDVVVEIHATAVNYVDLLVISGKYQFLPKLPFSPGKLPVGRIVAVGASVTTLAVGDRVLTMAEHGGYAELIVVPASQCFVLPHSMTFVQAASMALMFDTAWFALREQARCVA